MSNNKQQNPNCAIAESLISYVYGEIGAAEKTEFEAHLEKCAACHRELTELGAARSAMREWRASEFDNLAMPVFAVPTDSVKTQTVASETTRSRFADWRRLFSFKPALAMSALAILVALFGISFLAFDSENKNQIAGKSDDEVIKTHASPTIEKSIEQPKSIIAAENNDKPGAPDKEPLAVAADEKSAAQKNPNPKTAVKVRVNNASDAVAVKIADAGKTVQKSPAARKTKTPRLTEAEDEEDDSVRLADLFDEIETR